jgi:hypothetical protein
MDERIGMKGMKGMGRAMARGYGRETDRGDRAEPCEGMGMEGR